MMASYGPRGEVVGGFTGKRGHASQLSITDPSHHVTEAIGTLYGDEDDSGSESGRPMSFIANSYQDHLQRPHRQISQQQSHSSNTMARGHLTRSISDQPSASISDFAEGGGLKKSQTLPLPQSPHRYENGTRSFQSAPLSLRDVKVDSAGSQFPLTDIDNPNDIAQELSNLQALRRLSMDVGNNIDPDMPPMSLSAIPAIAPSGSDDENDPSRLLWVPARVHPELAPSEFKSFLENRVHSIRRRSGESFLSPDGDSTRTGSGSLNRRKSMLSHQIDNDGGEGVSGYVDGAERLERKRSRRSQHGAELSLEDLVKDPKRAVQKLTEESQTQRRESQDGSDDMPILPMAPGMGLRRSTRTTYRKGGSLRSNDRLTLSRRLAQRQQDEPSEVQSRPSLDIPKGHSLARVQSEPITENYSRPNRSVRRQLNFSQESPAALAALEGNTPERGVDGDETHIYPNELRDDGAVSQKSPESMADATGGQDESALESFPQRSSSQSRKKPSFEKSTEKGLEESSPPSSVIRTKSNNVQNYAYHRQQQAPQPQQYEQYTSKSPATIQNQSLSEGLASNPSFPGGGNTRTDALTFIPTLTQDDRKPDKKSKKDRDEESSSFSSKSSGAWKWLKGVGEDKEKKKEEGKKAKAKAVADKIQDNARLDVLQTSIDKSAPKGRESLVLDRDSFDTKLQEERKKESNRKSDSKKDKDGSIFSSIFGGSKRKEEKEKSSKKQQYLQVPEDPPYKPLQPDIDYNWTRFPLLEERAIYRMAHIKLANPRRSLQSQVLLSNFMYSYLAIVQAMHPQMNIPVSPQQKRLEDEARRKRQEQEYAAQQGAEGDDQQDIDQYNFEYHRSAIQYADSGSSGQVDYVDDAQIYEDDHGEDHSQQSYDYDVSKDYGTGTKDYYQYQGNGRDHQHDGGGNMW